eukprot:g45387.t1
MFGFHKPKMYRSLDGCCICRAKSSSSRFTDSKRYEKDFQSCFGLNEARSGEICNACVLLVKRWKKLPVGSKKNWNHVVDVRAGPSLKTALKPKKAKSLTGNRIKASQISKIQKELKRQIFIHIFKTFQTWADPSKTGNGHPQTRDGCVMNLTTRWMGALEYTEQLTCPSRYTLSPTLRHYNCTILEAQRLNV